jgi:SNF2 family DNA or RNA helicase
MIKRELDHEEFRGGILADEVGLGKTIMTTGVLLENPKKNTLIILPKSLISQWKSEIQKYTNALDICTVENDEISLNTDESVSRVHIVSHSRFNKRGIEDPTQLSYCNVEWDRVVIDEAHIIKNKKSKIHKAVCNLSSPIRWALTATPVMNKMTDFVYTMKWVSQDTIDQLDCQRDMDNIVSKYILRRTKEDVKEHNVQFELPELTVEINNLQFINLMEKQLYENKYKEMQEKIRELKKTLGNQSVIYALEMLLRARQICCHPQCYIDGINKKNKQTQKKLGKNSELLNDFRSMDDWDLPTTKITFVKDNIQKQPVEDKTLIFCHFIKEMDIYQKELEKCGHTVFRIDGRIDLETRDFTVQKFKDAEIKHTRVILLIQIDMGGQGFNFQCANRIYITSPTWNPAQQHQVIGRAHRTGQSKPVHVNILTIESGDPLKPYVETNMLEIQKSKRKLMAEVLNDPRLENNDAIADTKLTFHDLEKVFRI